MPNIGKIIPNFTITSEIEDYDRYLRTHCRRISLQGRILSSQEASGCGYSTIDELVELIMFFNQEDKELPVEDRDPIILYINSPGGDTEAGFALVDAIKLSKTPVHTVAYGSCESMAFLIFIAGDKRFVFPRTTLLMHDGQMLLHGTPKQVQDWSDFSKRFEKEVVKPYVLKNSKMNATEYARRVNKENCMLPEDAIKYGFADEIVDDIDKVL